DVAHAATLRAMRTCDLFLRTTLYDGDAVSVREAIHLGVPVIATDNGMRPVGCDLIPIADAGALIRAIEQRLRRPQGPRTEPGNGEENLERVVAIYREILQTQV